MSKHQDEPLELQNIVHFDLCKLKKKQKQNILVLVEDSNITEDNLHFLYVFLGSIASIHIEYVTTKENNIFTFLSLDDQFKKIKNNFKNGQYCLYIPNKNGLMSIQLQMNHIYNLIKYNLPWSVYECSDICLSIYYPAFVAGVFCIGTKKNTELSLDIPVLFHKEFDDLKQINIPYMLRGDESIVNFDEKKYKTLNFDLRNFNPEFLYNHFLYHGWLKESRPYHYPDLKFDKPKKFHKNRVLILNHSSSLAGAPIVAFNLFKELQKKTDSYVLTPQINKKLIRKLNISIQDTIIEYHHNPKYILDIIHYLNPRIIIINSFSSEFLDLVPELNNYHNVNNKKVIYYIHESIRDYIPKLANFHINGDFICADHRSQIEFKNIYPNISVYPPKFIKEYLDSIKIKPLYQVTSLYNSYRLKNNKKIIGMVGSPTDKKNFLKFCSMAKEMNEFLFIWVGGKKSYKINNLIVFKETENVLTFLNHFNLFWLTSKSDTCPMAVLESLYLNIPVLYSIPNVGYNYIETELLIGLNKDSSLVTRKDIEKVLSLKFEKKSNNMGKKYILDHFTYTKEELKNKFI